MRTRFACGLWIWKAGLVALAVALAVPALVASGRQFEERRRQLTADARAAQQAAGLAGPNNRARLFKEWPTPEVRLARAVSVQPGQSVKVSVPGRYASGTAFLFSHDRVGVSDESASTSAYTATLRIDANAQPGFVHLHAFTPVSDADARAAIAFIGPVRPYEFASRDGWTVKMTPLAEAFVISESDASLPYQVDFFRAGNETPVETMSGAMRFEASARVGSNVYINLERGKGASAAAEFERLMQTMGDQNAFMKMTPRQQEDFYKKLEKATEAMMAEAASAQKQADDRAWQQEFGCTGMTLWFDDQPRASVSCGRTINRIDLELRRP